MVQDRTALRKAAVVERRPAVPDTTQRNAVAVAPSPARALQQRLGNHGAQLFAAQVVARSSAPNGPLGGGTSAGPFSLSHPDDAHEREADRVADVVMRTTVRGSTSTSPSMPTVQRVCADCEEEISTRERADHTFVAGDPTHAHRSASAYGASQVSAPVAASIHDMQGGGAPLAAATRAFFEPRFGADFSHVRVHTGARADSTAKAISAKAFTVGADIVFAGGEYAPESREGQQLLAHELTHVVQQDAGTRRLNRQADRVNPGIVTAANGPTIQRDWYNIPLPFGYELDPSWEGIKTAATIVKDTAAEGLQWVVDQITDLVHEALAWLGEQWESLKGLMRSAFNAAKDALGNIVSFFLSPLGLLTDALMRLDPAALSKSWAAFSSVVTSVANGFKTMAAGLLKPFEVVWGGINRYATWVLGRLSGLLGNFLFKKLPNFMQRIARDAVNRLKSVWKTISDGWTAFYNEIKSWVDGAIDAVAGFVHKVVSFAIDVVIAAIVKFGQVLGFLKDFVADPGKYIAILAKRCVQAFDGVESRFAGVVSQYFGTARATAPATAAASAAPIRVHRAPVSGAGTEPRTSATWGEIGEGIAEMMAKKWQAFKANPMTVVTGLLKDLFIPIVGNVQDIIQLFHDIKKIVTGPLNADSLQDLWTSLLQILDIPILIYNTAVSILMRTLMLPLLIAAFIPVVREIAVAVGLGLLVAFLGGVGANLAQKMLLLKTGVTVRKQKEDAYNSVADNLIALAITAVIMLLAVLLPAIYGLMKGVYNFIKGKVFGVKVPPVEAKGTGPGEGKGAKGGPEEGKDTKPKTDGPAAKDLGTQNGKKVLAEKGTADGKHKVKVTEEGIRCCSDLCELMIKDIDAHVADNPALKEKLDPFRKQLETAQGKLESARIAEERAPPEGKAQAAQDVQAAADAAGEVGAKLKPQIEAAVREAPLPSGRRFNEYSTPEQAMGMKEGKARPAGSDPVTNPESIKDGYTRREYYIDGKGKKWSLDTRPVNGGKAYRLVHESSGQ